MRFAREILRHLEIRLEDLVTTSEVPRALNLLS